MVLLLTFVSITRLQVGKIISVMRSFLLFVCEALTEWQYLSAVCPRPPKGFVELRNAGATCYMSSVMQQLYVIPSIRNSILVIEGTGSDTDYDIFNDEKDNEVNFHYKFCCLCINLLVAETVILYLNIIVIIRFF